MSQEQVANILLRMVQDTDYASEVVNGDFTDLDEEELTEAEQALVRAAAGEISPEVGGFKEWGRLSDYEGISGPFQAGYDIGNEKIPAPPAPYFQKALEYTGIFKF